MDCTLKSIAGPETGQEFHCNGDQVTIGRSARCIVRLSSPAISYEHAMISRTGTEFFVENLSASGTFLNNERLATRTRLRPKDQIRLAADTILRVESLPTATSAGSTRTGLLGVVVALLVIFMVVVVLDPFSGESNADWPRAYAALQQFTLDQSAKGELPSETSDLFREAWRLETSGDRANAGKAWLRLGVLIDNAYDKTGIHASARQGATALEKMMAPGKNPPILSTEELHAALPHFVRQMERRK